jgi:hypothetical protein
MNENPLAKATQEVSFTCAVWDFLRGERKALPKPEGHGLTAFEGAALIRQCVNEARSQRHRKVKR